MFQWFLRWNLTCKVGFMDDGFQVCSAVHLRRQGVGRARHLSNRVLRLQNLINDGTIKLSPVEERQTLPTGAKRLASSRLRLLMAMRGTFNTFSGLVGGSDDPGNVLKKKQKVVSILSLLGLLQLKGCQPGLSDHAGHPGLDLMVFTMVLGLLFVLLWICLRDNRQVNVEPDAGPEAIGDPLDNDDSLQAAETMNATAPQLP
eukprot:s1997_g15.t1